MAGLRELTTLSTLTLSALLKDREVSAVEVVEAHLDRIDALNPSINAFCTVTHEAALAAAREADAALQRGAPTGPLHGLPIGLKDLTPTEGVRTTRGSKLFEHFVPTDDAIIVKRMKAAGGIIVGKTNTPEFGHKGITDNLLFGPTRNPWRLDRVAGGSSGGSAAAVAAGMVPLAEGSDGAGSIRIPASLCGVFGFKPTYGRVPDVMGPFASHSAFFHNGPIARSVTDAALFYQAIAGEHPGDPFSLPGRDEVMGVLEAGVRGLKIAYSPDLGYFDVAPDVARACRAGAQLFAELGCEVKEIRLDFDKDIERQFMVLWWGRLATNYAGLPKQELALLEPKVQEFIAAGSKLSAVEYGRANLAREKVWNSLARVLDQYDLLVCPTTAVAAFPHGQPGPSVINGNPIDPIIGWFLTYPFNLTGHPAASIPCGLSDDGLPVGLQLIGRRLEDGLVLKASRAFEQLAPWPRIAAPRPVEEEN